MPNAKQLLRRYDRLKADRGTWETQWQEIGDHLLGRRDFTNEQITGGRKRMARIYDTTALISADLLASALHSFLTNSATRWFDLRTEDDRLMEFDEVVEWLEGTRLQMLNAFNRPEAGFNPQIHEVYFDLVTFCTAVFWIEDEPRKGPKFSARPLGESYITEDASGRVDGLYRRYKLTSRQAIQEFGDKAPEKAHKNVGKGNDEDKLEFLHVVLPREDPVPGRLNQTGMPWSSFHVDMEKEQMLGEGGFWEMPGMVARWSKDAGEMYGRGPGIMALADAKMLNEMWKTTLTGAQKRVNPPMLMDDDGVITQLRLAPNSINIQRATSLRPDSVRPIQTNVDANLGMDLIEIKRQNVQSAFHSEMLPLFQRPFMTATQVLEVANQAQRFLSPVLGRAQTELLEPMIERVFGIELRGGRLPPVPAALVGQSLRIEYVSPVARAQRASDTQAIIDTFAVAHDLGQQDPSILDNLDADLAIREVAEAKGIPPSIVRDAAVVAEIRRGQAELARQQEQQEQVREGAEMISKVVPAMAKAGQAAGA